MSKVKRAVWLAEKLRNGDDCREEAAALLIKQAEIIQRMRDDKKRLGARLRVIADRLPNVADCDAPQSTLWGMAIRLGA